MYYTLYILPNIDEESISLAIISLLFSILTSNSTKILPDLSIFRIHAILCML